MKTAFQKSTLVIAGAILFNIIFWQEKLALNSLFFDVFILWSVFYLYPAAFLKPAMKWLLAAHLITLVTVIIHNTILSKLAFTVTMLLVVTFTQYLHRSVWYAGASALMNYIWMIPSFIAGIGKSGPKQPRLLNFGKLFRFMIMPLLILGVFLLVYSLANAIFNELLIKAGIFIGDFFARFFDWFSWARFGFLLVGLFITGGLLLKSKVDYFSVKDTSQYNDMWRKKRDGRKWQQGPFFHLLSLFMGRFANGMMALRNENTVGMISLLLLNLLLLCINTIDIIYVWFGFSYTNGVNLSAYVHEGAGFLIFSILLAMLILLFFFRGNLNFFKRNKWLKYGAYAWIFQNLILVVSVVVRDYYYIHSEGLAYKRIGVLVFVLLVLGGLITVFIKIWSRKTNYYLLRVNAWFAITVLVVSSCIHWDHYIATYNLSRKDSVGLDLKFLLSLSDKAIPVLDQHKDVFTKQPANPVHGEGDYLYRSELTLLQVLEKRKKDFAEEQKEYSWLSWNMADAYVKTYLHLPVITGAVRNKE